MPPENEPTQGTPAATLPANPPATSAAQPTQTAGVNAGALAPLAPQFTQADLDRIAGQTRKEAKSAERAALLKELGVEDLDQAKQALKAAEEARKAQMTQEERLKTEKAELERRATEAEAARQKAEQERQAALVEAEIVARASGRFANPKAVIRLIDLAKVKVGEGGVIEGVDEALNALAEKEPWTLAQKGATVPSLGPANPPRGGGGTAKEDEMRAAFFGGGNVKEVFAPRSGGVRLGN